MKECFVNAFEGFGNGKESDGAKVVALVPAHNEENGIRENIKSLIEQTCPVDILVVSDNSTDQTVSIVQEVISALPKEMEGRLKLIETVDNKFKKSGALNAAYRLLGNKLNEYNFVLSMDADTVLASDVVEQGMMEFGLDLNLGAVCSRAGVIKQATDGFLEKLVYHWQYVEYAEFDRSRIAQHRKIKVAHGMCTLYKVEAIEAVMKKRIDQGRLDCTVYDVYNITEDYELTVCIKECGYNTAVGLGMYAWTDVPLKLKDLWKQRVRWLRGGLDTLWQHGLNKTTRGDIINAGFFWIMLAFQVILLNFAVMDALRGAFRFNAPVIAVMALMYADCIYTLRYVQKPEVWDYLVRITFIPQLFYAWFTIAQQLYAYYQFFFKHNQEW